MKIKELPELERPYEKLELYGEKMLSDAELLAIIIKTGTKKQTSVQLAQELLGLNQSNQENFSFLQKLTIEELMQIKGIGKVKAIQLKAVGEISARMFSKTKYKKMFINEPKDLAEILIGNIKSETNEKVIVKEVVVKEPAETKVRLSQVEPNREQPRKMFDEDALIELSESIKQYGVLQPLLVQKKDNYYEIIAGERRWRAAKLAGVKEVPVIIKDYSDQEVMEIALIENIQREDLNPIEEAQAYQRLIKDYRLKQDEVAEKVSKSRAAITNSLRLLKLDSRVQEMVMEGKLSNGHARTIIGIEDGDKQYMIAQKIFDEKLSVREVEKLMRDLDKPEKPVKQAPENDFIYRDLEDKFSKILGSQVAIKNKNNNKGKIEIEYYSQAELERIYEMLKKTQE